MATLIFCPLWLKAEKNLKVYDLKLRNGNVAIVAENTGFIPYTLIVECKLTNMKSSVRLPAKIVIEAIAGKQKILELEPIRQRKGWRYSYKYTSFKGNTEDVVHNDDYPYYLPYEAGAAYRLIQGYNGKFSHRGRKALDFDLPIGAKVCAAREGIVSEIKEDSNRGCKSERCKDLGNFVEVYHSDGTFAMYYHLQKNGALVKPGQKVEKGEVIGLSGNTGWTTGPHLHFEIYKPTKGQPETIPVKFLWAEGQLVSLTQGLTYKAFREK